MIDRKSFEPMYQQIKRDIEQQILSGQIKIGDKLMSETEMLEHYHVARMTVRAALTELVNNGCLAKERGRGTFCVALPRQAKRVLTCCWIQVITTLHRIFSAALVVCSIGKGISSC